jgi:glutamine amidotransferase
VIALIDYGAGNLTSVRKALTALEAPFFTPATAADCGRASALIVPGVGNFAATAGLEGDWRETIGRAVASGTPLLGICLGMQWLFDASDEAPDVKGLGVIRGRIVRLQGDPERRLKVPHVGWNALDPPPAPAAAAARSRLLRDVPAGAQVYFTHSYAAPVTAECAAATTHAGTFASVVERDNIFGVQFHPEKSGTAGLQILRNFLQACRAPLGVARSGGRRC